MMFITGYWRIHTNKDLFKDIRPERQALQELLMNLGIIAMWGKSSRGDSSEWNVLGRICGNLK